MATSREEIQAWLTRQISRRLDRDPASLGLQQPLSELGLSSEQTLSLAGDLENWLGRRLNPELLYEHSTISALSTYLSAHKQIPAVDREPEAAGARRTEPVAIVGIGCRFPGAGAGPRAFFEFLRKGASGITEVPPDRWDWADVYDPDPNPNGKALTKWGGFLTGLDSFDPAAFRISPAEAERMDPQQRLVLEAVWHAAEDAGLEFGALAGSATGVFVGICNNEYARRFTSPELVNSVTPTGNALSIAANRVSYVFDLHGPSVAIDTACSSSLAATHFACQSLNSGECELAFAGGVNVMLTPELSVAFSQAGVISPEGECRPFDHRASGIVRGEGVGVVVLKRLEDALRDKDEIYAEILGTAIVQDGRSNGLMAPRASAQEAAIRKACQAGGLEPGQLGYVEAHGTGTRVGDRIEASALADARGSWKGARGPCMVGSVKSNLGHLEAAAGIAGLIKTALCLRHKVLFPTPNFEKAPDDLPLAELGLSVSDRFRPWPADGERRLAGVSSFGFGGTNVHAVLGEAARPQAADPDPGEMLELRLSALDPRSLRSLAEAYAKELELAPHDSARRLVQASAHRTPLSHRLATFAGTPLEIRAQLVSFADTPENARVWTGIAAPGKLAFVFSGQSTLRPGAGRRLFESSAVFREALLRCDEALREHLGESVLPILFAHDPARFARSEWSQPALFAFQTALWTLLRPEAGSPTIAVGHSIGEVAAAHATGSLSLADAARLAVARGRAMEDRYGRGRMALAVASRDEVENLIGRDGSGLVIGAVNSARSVIVSGPPSAIDALIANAPPTIPCFAIPLEYAGHGPQMDEPAIRLAKAMEGLSCQSASRVFYSTVEPGRYGKPLDAAYWAKNIRAPVAFEEAVHAMLADGVRHFVEIGAHPVLARDLKATLGRADLPGEVIPAQHAELDELEALQEARSRLFITGAHEGAPPGRVRATEIPPYPFEARRRLWFDRPATPSPRRRLPDHPLRPASDPGSWYWRAELSTTDIPWLTDWSVAGRAALPSGILIELLAVAAADAGFTDDFALADLDFPTLLSLVPANPVSLQLSGRQLDQRLEIRVDARSRDTAPWTNVARCSVEAAGDIPRHDAGTAGFATAMQVDAVGLTEQLAAAGVEASTAVIAAASLGHQTVRGQFANGQHGAIGDTDLALARRIDASLNLLTAAGDGQIFTPRRIDRIVFRALDTRMATVEGAWSGALADLHLASADRTSFVELGGIVARGAAEEIGAALALDHARRTWTQVCSRAIIPAKVAPPAEGASILLFGRGNAFDALYAEAASAGASVFRAVPGTRFRRIEPAIWELSPERPDHFRKLLECCSPGVTHLIHAWSDFGRDPQLVAVRRSLASLNALDLAGQELLNPPAEFVLLTHGAIGQVARTPAEAAQSAARGWMIGVGNAAPNRKIRCIDADADELRPAGIWSRLGQESGPDVAVRRGTSQAPKWTTAGAAISGSRLNPGAYLVVGSGQEAARVVTALREMGAVTVAVVEDVAGAAATQRMAADTGEAWILRWRGDLGKVTARQHLGDALGRLPEVRGIVCLSGAPEQATATVPSASKPMDRFWRGVVRSELLLDALSAAPLDFFALVDPGAPESPEDAATNAYVLTRAREWALGGCRIIRLSVSLRCDADEDIIATLTGEAFASGEGHIRIASGGPAAELQSQVPEARTAEPVDPDLTSGARARPPMGYAAVAPRTIVEERLQQIWASVLGFDDVGVTDDFFALGGDSVVAGQLLVEISKAFGVSPAQSKAFETFTIAHLADLVEAALLEQIAGLDDAAVAALLSAAGEDEAAA